MSKYSSHSGALLQKLTEQDARFNHLSDPLPYAGLPYGAWSYTNGKIPTTAVSYKGEGCMVAGVTGVHPTFAYLPLHTKSLCHAPREWMCMTACVHPLCVLTCRHTTHACPCTHAHRMCKLFTNCQHAVYLVPMHADMLFMPSL